MRNIRRVLVLGVQQLAIVLVLAASVAALPACKSWWTTDTLSKIVDCGQQAIRDRGLIYVGRVNDVLGNSTLSDRDARARLVELGVDAGQDVIGCLLREQQPKFAENASRNPADRTSAVAAQRADDRLRELEADGWRFE